MTDNPISMWFAGNTYESWKSAGYMVEIVEAVTPDTIKDFRWELIFEPIKKLGVEQRPFSDTEKAVCYSHLKCWDIVRRKASPAIIIEHDALLTTPWIPNDLHDFGMVPLCKWGLENGGLNTFPAVAYYMQPAWGQRMFDLLLATKIKGNIDAYLWRYMQEILGEKLIQKYAHYVTHQKDDKIGNTILHPDIGVLNG